MDDPDHKPAGWYPDALTPLVERWWNGISWGDQTRTTSNSKPIPTASMTTPRPVDPYAHSAPTPPPSATPRTTGTGQFRFLNPIGYAGVVLGFISILFNFFCIPSILAIILSSIGLNAAHKLKLRTGRAIGWNWCIAGLAIGGLETVAYVISAIK